MIHRNGLMPATTNERKYGLASPRSFSFLTTCFRHRCGLGVSAGYNTIEAELSKIDHASLAARIKRALPKLLLKIFRTRILAATQMPAYQE